MRSIRGISLSPSKSLKQPSLPRSERAINPRSWMRTLPSALSTCCEASLPLAIEHFNQVHQLAPHDAKRCLRAASYRHLAVFLHFNLFPGGAGSSSLEVDSRWQGVAYLQEEHPRWQALLGQIGDPAAQVEAWLVHQVLPNLQPARATLESSRFVPPVPQVAQMVENTLQGLAMFQQAAGSFPYGDLAAADLCRRAGRLPESQDYLQRAFASYEHGGDAVGMAVCIMTRGDWLAAPFSSPLLMNFLLSEGSSEGSDLGWLTEKHEANRDGLDVAAARDAYDNAERLFAQANARRGLAAVQLRRAWLSAVNDDFEGAAKLAERARAAFEKCGDMPGYWLAQTHLATYLVSAGRRPEPVELTAAAGACGSGGGSFAYALGLGLLINRAARDWLIRRGDYERAVGCYRLGHALFAALGATSNSAQSLIDRGRAHQAVGDRITALILYEQALDVMEGDVRVRPQVGDALRRRIIMLAASVYLLYQQQTDADGMERSARRIKTQGSALSQAGETASSTTAMLERLVASISAGETAKGSFELPVTIEQLSLASMGNAIVEQATVLVPLYRAVSARDSGKTVEADRLLEAALCVARAASEGQRHFLEATVLATWKQRDAAVAAFERHLKRGGANAGFAGMLGEIMSRAGGNYGEAERRIQEVRTHEQAFTFLLRNKAYAQAKMHLDALERIEGEEWWKHRANPWQELSARAEMHEGLGDLSAALRSYDMAITELEARRRLLTRDELKSALAADRSAQYLYFLAARVAVKSGDQARALRYVENGKARALLDLMAATRAGQHEAEAGDEFLRRWRQLNAQLALTRGLLAQARNARQPDEAAITNLTDRITAEEEQLRQVEKGLAERHPSFQQAVSTEARIISLDEAAAVLPTGAALLQYAFLGEDLLAWAITREGMAQTHIEPLDAKRLSRQIRAFHQACAKRREVAELSQELAQTLLSPFAAIIRAHPQLIVVPYGASHLLPFQALPFDGQPLSASHIVSYLPSVSTLQFLPASRRATPATILALGNPTGDLPAAEVEAQYVASLYGQSALLGDQATEEAVRRQVALHPLLHFATHGKLSAEAPLSSALLLAHGEELTVYELMGLHIDADLVVLSACETARGEVTGGDDIVGLTRGLLAAGARAALVSLWPVDDLSTSLFMGEFYRRLRAGENAIDALQAAQNYLRNMDQASRQDALAESLAPAAANRSVSLTRHFRPDEAVPENGDYHHPYYWAPFVLIGRGWS
jgi:CHAT domain-containing protein